jgi:lipopolysaccharide export LptBFGC system permease protein LptF
LNLVFALLIYFFYSNLISIAQVWVSRGKVDFTWAFATPHVLGLVVFGLMMLMRVQQPRNLFWYVGAFRTKLFRAVQQ